MRICRRGTERNRGRAEISVEFRCVKWDSKTCSVVVYDYAVDDFSTNSRHNYTLYLSLDDVGAIVGAAVGAITCGYDDGIKASLGKHLLALRQLSLAASSPDQLGYDVTPDKEGGFCDSNGYGVTVALDRKGWIRLRAKPRRLIVVKARPDGTFDEEYNGPGLKPWKACGSPDKHGLRKVQTKVLRKMARSVRRSRRVARKD